MLGTGCHSGDRRDGSYSNFVLLTDRQLLSEVVPVLVSSQPARQASSFGQRLRRGARPRFNLGLPSATHLAVIASSPLTTRFNIFGLRNIRRAVLGVATRPALC